jgi:hypothetical protein
MFSDKKCSSKNSRYEDDHEYGFEIKLGEASKQKYLCLDPGSESKSKSWFDAVQKFIEKQEPEI